VGKFIVLKTGTVKGENMKAHGYSKLFGWSSWSKADAYAIISGYRVGHTPEGNRYRQYVLHRILHDYGVSFFKARGAYDGETEEVCVVPLHYENTLSKVRKIARGLDQETILIINNGHFAALEWLESGDRVEIGKFTRVDATLISTLEAWTLIDGALYTCIEESQSDVVEAA
jgi:hypothetical protein